jgi:RimK family alpha-L-glutamate ligase
VRVGILGTANITNGELAAAWCAAGIDARCVGPVEALAWLRPGDTLVVRLDVLPTLDGVEPGLETAEVLASRGVAVVNRPDALLRAHDKLLTAQALGAAGLPHPETLHLAAGVPAPADVRLPCVLKPRFGSWGVDVVRCMTREELEARLTELRTRGWYEAHGVLLQELIPPVGHDLRVVVAAGRVVASAQRVSAPGEWRTNVSLGGSLAPVDSTPEADALATAAASALGCDLVGVDLLPAPDGQVVLELNGAVDFDERYGRPGQHVLVDVARALALLPAAALQTS